MQPVELVAVTPTPKRRWCQFSLRTLLVVTTLSALPLCWWNHRSFCLRRIEFYSSVSLGADTPWQQAVRRIEFHQHTADAYQRAIWRPWLRLWIDETPPEPNP